MELGDLNEPVLIFGGAYSNLAATEVMHAEAKRLGISPDKVICNGDLVAYCAEPEATVNLIREWGIHVVMGNCEESLAADAQDCGCGFSEESMCSLLSVEWYRFARENVSSDNKIWMSQLPRQITFNATGKVFTVVHGSVESINEFVFHSSSSERKSAQLALSKTDVVIGGHSGIPFKTNLDKGHWLNSGVIGMPANDGTPDGWYMLLEPFLNQVKVSWHRLQYEVERTAASMSSEGISAPYVECLRTGYWPSIDILPKAEVDQTGIPIMMDDLLIS